MMLKEFWKTYKWLIVVFLVFPIVALIVFGNAFTGEVAKAITDTKWWAGNYLTFLVFTVIVGVVVHLYQSHRETRRREPFEKWKLVIKGSDIRDQNLSPGEVETILESDFERWKMVKSVVSGVGRTNLITIHPAEAAEANDGAWVTTDREKRRLIVDLNKAEKRGHMTRNKPAPQPGNPL